MTKYRKKPVIVDAVPYEPGMEDGYEYMWPYCPSDNLYKESKGCKNNCALCHLALPYILTLEGKLHSSPGDYIITGIKGERYPIKADQEDIPGASPVGGPGGPMGIE